MAERSTKIFVPSGATTIKLPDGTTHSADIHAEILEVDADVLNIKQDIKDPELARIAASTRSRNVLLKVVQDTPFEAFSPTGSEPWNLKSSYQAGNHVWYKGRVYRAKVDHLPTDLAYMKPDLWENTTGDTGMVITRMSYYGQPMVAPEGCWPLDGTQINAPWSPLHGYYTDNLNGKVIVGGSKFANDPYQVGKTSGADNFLLSLTQLPKDSITISGKTSQDTAGRPAGTVRISGYTGQSGSHAHSLYGNAGWDGTNGVGGSDRSSNWFYGTTSSAGDHQHWIDMTGQLSSSDMPNHQHSFSGSATLNPYPQAGISTRQPSVHLLQYVRL